MKLPPKNKLKTNIDVNVFGIMRTNKNGVIVNISSVAGRVGLPFASIYESSKFAVKGFSETLNLVIKVKIIEPGSSRTNFGNAQKSTANEISDYNPFLAKFFVNYPKQTAPYKTAISLEVAETIYNAVADKSNKLRYTIGEDCQFFVDAKDKNSEENYIKSIQNFFE